MSARRSLIKSWPCASRACARRSSRGTAASLLHPVQRPDRDAALGGVPRRRELLRHASARDRPPGCCQKPRGVRRAASVHHHPCQASPTRPLPRIKLDLTADERVVLEPAIAEIFHPYSDPPEEGIEVPAYDYVEAFAEKFRALAERTRHPALRWVCYPDSNGTLWHCPSYLAIEPAAWMGRRPLID
jgi:hypothetical protein